MWYLVIRDYTDFTFMTNNTYWKNIINYIKILNWLIIWTIIMIIDVPYNFKNNKNFGI